MLHGHRVQAPTAVAATQMNSGAPVVLDNLTRTFGATRALDGFHSTSRRANSSHCSVRRVVGKLRRCVCSPASRTAPMPAECSLMARRGTCRTEA